MFLSMADFGEKKTIARITGKEDTRHHLESLGFVEGADVTVVSSLGERHACCHQPHDCK